MDSPDVVRETTIFAALSPRGYERRQRPLGSTNSRDAARNEGGFPGGSLPPVTIDTSRPSSKVVSPKTPRSLLMSVPITSSECWVVWKFLCDWVKSQFAMEVPASIPGFGTFFIRVQAFGIRMPLFEPDKQFLNQFGLKVDVDLTDPNLGANFPVTISNPTNPEPPSKRSEGSGEQNIGELFAFSFLEMAACCGNSVDATRAKEWLAVILQKLGHAMSRCGRVELNIGVGVIVCVDRVIQRRLSARDSSCSTKIEYEVRSGESVVKRNMRAQAAFQSKQPPKVARYSFLSGPTFSSSIELNPVVDRLKDVPSFTFGAPNPRRPIGSPLSVVVGSRSSPRSTQLQKRNQRTTSPLIDLSTPTRPSQLNIDNEGEESNTLVVQGTNDESKVPPQLFDPLSRTHCVEPDQNISCLLPSNRIGSNFTETAAYLLSEKYPGRSGQGTNGVIFIEKPKTVSNLRQRTQSRDISESISERRYFQYLTQDAKLIDREYLAPLSPDIETRIVSSAGKCVTQAFSDDIKNVMDDAHQEFVDIYYTSVKKSILNYLLMREASRERLGIPYGVPAHALLPEKWKWGSSDGLNGCMRDLKTLVENTPRLFPVVTRALSRPSTTRQCQLNGTSCAGARFGKSMRRKRVQSKLMSLLVLANPQVRALRYKWYDLLTSITLVDLPNLKNPSNDVQPMDIIEFERSQLAYSAKMKSLVMERWYATTKLMFETAIKAETFSIHTSESAVNFRLRHLFDTVAAVMSLQIRSLVMKSVQAYVNFFEQFGGTTEDYAEHDATLNERPANSGLLTTLILQDGQLQFRDPLVDIPSRLLNVLHNIPKLFYNVGRIETQFEEPILLPNTPSPFLWNVASQEDDIVVATIRIRAIIEHNLAHLRKLQAEYDSFALAYRYVNSVDCFHLEESSELDSYRTEMERVQATAMRLAFDNRHLQSLGLFSVDCRNVNTKLHTELAQWTIRLLEAFEQRTGRMNAELRQQYKEIAARLAKKPLDLYELVDAEAFVHVLKSSKLKELEERGNTIKHRLRFLLFERENMHIGNIPACKGEDASINDNEDGKLSTPETGFRLSIDLLSSTAKTVKWRTHIEKLLKEAEGLLVNERARIEAMFIAKRSRFQTELDEFEGEVKGFAKKGDLRHAATYVVQLAKMKDNMFIFRQAMDTICKEEQKLQWKPTDFGKLDDIAEEMAPYEQLWKTVREFREMNSRWLRGNVFELPGKEGLQTLQQMLVVVANVSSVLLLNSAAAAITAETVRKQMTDFRENVRLIVAIQNPAMKDRHMKEVSELIGLDFSSDEPMTLLKLLENGAFEFVGDVVDISANATQEQHIEQALKEMEGEWEQVAFQFVPSKHPFSATYFLSEYLTTDESIVKLWDVVVEKSCSENIIAIIEDHLLRLQTLSCLSHAGPFVEDIASWQTFLSEMGQIIELLVVIEELWVKITPLFAAGIVETASNEANLFSSAAQLYRSLHNKLLCQPFCKELFFKNNKNEFQEMVSPTPAAALISDLEQCCLHLETIKGAIQVGLEAKRSSFSRFYLLSDVELVTALSLTKVPSDSKLWRSLSRCFPGVGGVNVTVSNEITALVSSIGEPFPLGSPIVTTDMPMSAWLTKLETSMITILHASIRAASSDLSRKEFRKWCLIWPEQSLIAALQCIWTLETEQANRDTNPRRAWGDLVNTLQDNVDAVSKEIRVAAYPHAKATLANVILLLTQLRDVSNTVLNELGGIWVDYGVDDSSSTVQASEQLETSLPSLAWIAHPRFYFVDSVLSVAIMTSSYLSYGFEYLGNGPSNILVTPLTLRCYHAIAQSATIYKGACLEGDAGSGKSTICYQFSRLCGRLYVTFQCANRRLLFGDLTNFVKATASSGAWLCIDNMHLMDAASISMVAILCSQVMASAAERHTQCTILNDKVRLRRGVLFMLTLADRQASDRSQLNPPASIGGLTNAQHFFRRIVVQAPDNELLAEYALKCGRFVHAFALAKLLVVVLKAFERGFELVNHSIQSTTTIIPTPGLLNIRLIDNIVKRAIELNNHEKERRQSNRKGSFFSSEGEDNQGVLPTGELHSNDSTSESIAKVDEERMEYRSVSLALREHVGSIVPSANLHLVDAVLRDCSAQSSAMDLRSTNSIRWMSRGSSMMAMSKMGAKKSLEDEVENYIRLYESCWKRFGVEFGFKAVQLLQTMRSHRVVVISGDVQTGKTNLYGALSRALTNASHKRNEERRINIHAINPNVETADAAIVAPTRYVVICPRALQLSQLFDLETDNHSQTVLYKLVHEAKQIYKAEKCTHTWLVFDGDLDIQWSEQLVYTMGESVDELPVSQKGLQLSSGKYLTIPTYIRVVIESTSLGNATPSFVSRIGTVHINSGSLTTDVQGWEHCYRVWKSLHKPEFEGFGEAIFLTLDALVTETVPATLAFVNTNFQNYGYINQGVTRIQWMLALFHSSLNQSWKKYTSLTSEKQRNTAIHCLFLQALVWGIGNTTDSLERLKFHMFLFDLILRGPKSDQSSLKRLVTLFFPSGLVGSVVAKPNERLTGATNLQTAAPASGQQTIYDYGFSVEFGSKWLRWTDYYDRWSRLQFEPGSRNRSRDQSIESFSSVFVPTEASAAAICMVNQLLRTNYPTVLIGPRDCGKTVCGSTWMLLSSANCQKEPKVSAAPETGVDTESSNSERTKTEPSSPANKVYAGFYTRASDVMQYFESFLQQIRIERQGHRKKDLVLPRSNPPAINSSPDTTATNPTVKEEKSTVFVFVDDLHCFDPERKMDSAIELLRMVGEYKNVVDPTTNELTSCDNLLPFLTLQVPMPNQQRNTMQHRDIKRLMHKFIPVTLQPFSDSDLSSICESFSVAPEQPSPSVRSSSTQASTNATNGPREAEQLQSIIIKASLTLYRLLMSSNDFSVVQRDAATNSLKVHYNFYAAKLFRLVKNICCDVRPEMLLAEKPALSRLWCHESARVFGDSLMDSSEISAFHRRVLDVALSNFVVSSDAFYPARVDTGGLQNAAVTQNWLANELHFSFIGEAGSGGVYQDGYHEVTDMSNLEAAVERGMVTMCRGNNSVIESLEIVLCSYVIRSVLRVNRLLRMGRRAILLLGERGRKLITVTRLACFMCKMTSIVYQVPEQIKPSSDHSDTSPSSDFSTTWTTMFRAAMLQSVRCRDSSLVLIVKDAILDSDAFPYRSIDQLLSGHDLRSDIIAHEDLDEEILGILREAAEQERNKGQSETSSDRSGTARPQTPFLFRSKDSILSFFFRCVRENLRIILAFSPSAGSVAECNSARGKSWAPILWRYPHIAKCSAINYFGEWTTDDLKSVAEKCVAQNLARTDKSSAVQYCDAAVQLYDITQRYLRTRVPESIPSSPGTFDTARRGQNVNLHVVHLDSSMLVDHLRLFGAHFEQLQSNVALNAERFTAGLEFIDQTAQTLLVEQTQAELLLPEVQQKTELRRRMSGHLEREKIATDKVNRGLELATSLAAAQRDRVVMVTQEYEDLTNSSCTSFKQMKAILEVFREAVDSEEDEDEDKVKTDETESEEATRSLTDEPKKVDAKKMAQRRRRRLIETFVSLERIPSSIYQLAECLGVILGIQPVEGHDDMDPDEVIMDYWKNVAKGLQTPEFWNTLMVLDVPNRVTEKMVASLYPICTSPDFDKSLFSSVHEVAGILCEWVQKCMAFARDFVLANPKLLQLRNEQELLKQAEGQVAKYKMEISVQATSSQHTNELHELSEVERQRADEKLHDTTSLLHLTAAAWKVLCTTRQTWKDRYDYYSRFARYWKGDLMLATAVIAYTSCLHYAERRHLIQLWRKALESCAMGSSSQWHPLHEIFCDHKSEVSKLLLNGLPPSDASALENAVIALNSYRLPLLIDSHEIATEWMKKHFKSSKASFVPAGRLTTDAVIWNSIETSIKQETPLILLDICEERIRGLQSFFGAKRRAQFDAINGDIGSSSPESGGYRCWCYLPDENPETGCTSQQHTTSRTNSNSHLTGSAFHFGSDACKVYLVYTDTNDTPGWMTAYLSQFTIIRFELTASFVETQALQKVLESHGRLRELTEIRALQHDMIICDEQIEGLEKELLDFFSTEKAEQVYADNAKTLRIIANRSSVTTLETTKAEAVLKVQSHWNSLQSYIAIAKRCLDAVWALDDFTVIVADTNNVFSSRWVWNLLIRAGETSNKNDAHLEELMAIFTSSFQQYVVMNLRDEDRLLFKFLLATRIWERRLAEEMDGANGRESALIDVDSGGSFQTQQVLDIELLVRLLSLVHSRLSRSTTDACRPTTKSLLALRPAGMKATTWSSVCFLAEGSGIIRQFISRMENTPDGQTAWKALMDLENSSSGDWHLPTPLDKLSRMCIVSAVHQHRFLFELEDFAAQELQRMHVASRQTSLLPAEGATPALHTVVTAAAHSALTQFPDRHRDLFHMWRSFSSASAPLIVFCPPEICFEDAVTDVAKRLGATMYGTETVQMLVADAVTFKKMLLQAMGKGHWIVLPNLHARPDKLAQLDEIYECLDEGHTHADFRLWVSLCKHSSVGLDTTESCIRDLRINRISTRREWGTGFLSLKRCLHHSFALLKQELEMFAFKSTVAVLSALVSSDIPVLNEFEEAHVKQLGVFHALVSCRDHFPFAQWKAFTEFGDTELCAAVRSLIALKNEDETNMKEHQNPLRAEGTSIWNSTTLRGVIANIYSAKVTAYQDEVLLECCIDLVLNAWPTEQAEVCHDPTSDAARIAIPEAIFAIEKLSKVPWLSILSAIPQFWPSESCGPILRDPMATKGLHSLDVITLWDPQHKRRDRSYDIITQLVTWISCRGGNIPEAILPVRSRKPETLSVVDELSSFIKSLESVVFELQSESEYRKPILSLIHHERRTLEQIRTTILQHVKRLESVIQKGQVLDQSTLELYQTLRGGRVPQIWLNLLGLEPGGGDGAQSWSLDRFQRLLVGRLTYFSTWQEPEEGVHILPLDKFRKTEYLLEAVHQHLVRNHVGSALCAQHCLQVVAAFEDSPRLVLPDMKEVVYFSGILVHGHLQLQILDSKGQRRRSSILPEGIPAILQVSSTCVWDSHIKLKNPIKVPGVSMEKASDHEKIRHGLHQQEQTMPTKFLCPIFRDNSKSTFSKYAETSINVASLLPLEQLVFSGSSLHIESCE